MYACVLQRVVPCLSVVITITNLSPFTYSGPFFFLIQLRLIYTSGTFFPNETSESETDFVFLFSLGCDSPFAVWKNSESIFDFYVQTF